MANDPLQRTFTFLGTGTSTGVPMIGCECSVCTSSDPRNSRYRTSALIRTAAGNFLIDTSPELRLQLIREKIRIVHAVLYTHYHVDHLYGLDDLRMVSRYLNGPIPIYCNDEVEKVIRTVFSYAIEQQNSTHVWVPSLDFHRIQAGQQFEVLGQKILPIPLQHAWFNVLGFRIDDLAYCTDVSSIPEQSWAMLEGVRILILDTLRYKPHPAHLSLDESLAIIARLRPEKAYLTHMSHEFDYAELNPKLPAGVEMAYDGLTFEF